MTALVVIYPSGARHAMSENASAPEPAKILAILIHPNKAKGLLTFDDRKR
jgi:hypothetical protein